MLRISYRVWSIYNRLLNNNNPYVLYVSNRLYTKKKFRTTEPATVEFLVRLLGVEHNTAAQIALNYRRMKKFSRTDIATAHALCVGQGFDAKVIAELPVLLFYRPFLLEQRISFYKDLGCPKILPHMITGFMPATKLTVKEFKEQQLLPYDADVTKNLLNSFGEESLPALESMPEDQALCDIHWQILRHYLRWKFEFTEERLERVMASRGIFRCQSFSIITEMLHILKNEFGFGLDRVKRNSFLIGKSPTNTRRILNEIKYFGNVESRDLIMKYPRLLHVTVDNLREKLAVLKEFQVMDETIGKCPEIFTLSSKTIHRRLVEFQTIDELKTHWYHPRFLSVIFYFEGVKKRLILLKELNVRCSSLHMLCSSGTSFNRYRVIGSDRTKGSDLLKFLIYEFGLEPKDERIFFVKRHTLWCQVPVLHVQETFSFLREQNYSYQDILENLQIVLYRSSQIAKELKDLDHTSLDPSWEITRSQELALCLYNIEKAYHFNGSGVWNCQTTDLDTGKDLEEQHSRSFRHTSNV